MRVGHGSFCLGVTFIPQVGVLLWCHSTGTNKDNKHVKGAFARSPKINPNHWVVVYVIRESHVILIIQVCMCLCDFFNGKIRNDINYISIVVKWVCGSGCFGCGFTNYIVKFGVAYLFLILKSELHVYVGCILDCHRNYGT